MRHFNSGMEILMNISKRIAFLRKEQGMTQERLAERCNLTVSAIQNYESGRRKPSFDALIVLADTFNVSLDYLVGRYENDKTRF